MHVVANEPDETEAADRARELDILQLVLQILLSRSLEHFLGVVINQSVLSLFSPLSQVDEFPIAVVNQFHQDVLGVLACSTVIENDLQQISHSSLVIKRQVRSD